MQNHVTTTTTDKLLAQLKDARASAQSLATLNAAVHLMGTRVNHVAKTLRLNHAVVRWAFLSGQSERASEVRSQVLRHLVKLAKSAEVQFL